MKTYQIAQKLRPLKFAYLVPPNDWKALEKIIQTNSYLWGAKYNPILPFFKKTPAAYKEKYFRIPTALELLQGNLAFYEPDFLVTAGAIKADEIKNPPCECIALSDITNNLKREYYPGYGIGMPEILKDVYNQEFKFVRKDQIKNFIPTYDKGCSPFLKALFGDFPLEVQGEWAEYIAKVFEAETLKITEDNYLSYLNDPAPHSIFRFTPYKTRIDYTGHLDRERYIVFFFSSESFLDVIDYINLRAAGFNVLPITKRQANTDLAKETITTFVEENSWIHPDNTHARFRIIIQKGRSISKVEFETFYRSISIPKFEDGEPRASIREWLPDFWNRHQQEQGRVNCASIISEERLVDVNSDGKYVKFTALTPSFIGKRGPYTYKARYANDIAISGSNSKDLEASIYPSGSEDVVWASFMQNKEEWLIKKSTITHFCRSSNSNIYLEPQRAEDLFINWLKSQGWTANISNAGKVAYQMLKHLGGIHGLSILISKPLIDFLNPKKDKESNSDADRIISKEDFFAKTTKIKNIDFPAWNKEAFYKSFIENKIVQLGTSLQCQVCSRSSWHAIDSLDYTIKCGHCLSVFDLPSHSPDSIKWSYKTIGPFAVQGKAAGAYSVLLTARFFEDKASFGKQTTTILSFDMEKRDTKKIEVDLALFFKNDSYFNRSTELIFAECKIEQDFKKKDVDNMRLIASHFPSAILVFATLKKDLTQKEKKLLRPFVNTCNKYYERDRPRNPVMILTQTELCSWHGPPSAWHKMEGKFKQYSQGHHLNDLLELCKATQDIYLDIKSWSLRWNEDWKKKKEQAEKILRNKPVT